MKIKSRCFLGIVIITVSTLIITGYLNSANSSQEVSKMSYDWPNYSTVKELVDNSDLIVIGNVIDDNKPVKNELKIILNENLPQEKKEKYLKEKLYEVVTESQIQISKVIKGEEKPNDIIRVQQTGGTYGEIKQVVQDMKYLKKGNKVIIYLKKTPDSSLYVPINALQSHNYIVNEKVKFNKGEVFIKDKSQDEISVSELIKDIEKNIN